MKLYEIETQIENLTNEMIDPETGEIDDAIFEQIEQLEMERDAKYEYLALKVKNLRSDAQALKAEKEAFAKREARANREADSIESYLTHKLDGEKKKYNRVEIGFRKSVAVEISDELKIPEEYKSFKTTSSPNKKMIKEAINNGEIVPGAAIVKRNKIQIN